MATGELRGCLTGKREQEAEEERERKKGVYVSYRKQEEEQRREREREREKDVCVCLTQKQGEEQENEKGESKKGVCASPEACVRLPDLHVVANHHQKVGKGEVAQQAALPAVVCAQWGNVSARRNGSETGGHHHDDHGTLVRKQGHQEGAHEAEQVHGVVHGPVHIAGRGDIPVAQRELHEQLPQAREEGRVQRRGRMGEQQKEKGVEKADQRAARQQGGADATNDADLEGVPGGALGVHEGQNVPVDEALEARVHEGPVRWERAWGPRGKGRQGTKDGEEGRKEGRMGRMRGERGTNDEDNGTRRLSRMGIKGMEERKERRG